MRILLCSNFYYRRGGDCTYLLALQSLLERNGHETAVFSMRHPQNLPCPQEEYFVDFLDYAALNRRKNPLAAVRVLSRSIWSRQARRNVARLVADWKPDIAHFQNVHAYLTPSILGPLEAAGVPVVWTLHDYKLICPNGNFFSNGRICEGCRGGRFWRCALNRCKKGSRAASAVAAVEAYVHRGIGIVRHVDRFIVPSEFVKRKFVEFGHSESRIQILPHFLNGAPCPAPGTGSYGLYAGTLMPFKGVGTLLRALAKSPPHPFHVLGGGEQLEDYRQQARELGLSQVVFREFLTGEELEAELSGAFYAVVPSEWWETFSYAAQEPLARGIPVIASDLGALPELVRDGETGLLFPPGDAEALAERIARLWGDVALRARLGSQAQAFIREKCAAGPYLRQLTDLYGAVLSGAAGKAGR